MARREPQPPESDEMRWVLLPNSWTLQPYDNQTENYEEWMRENFSNGYDPLIPFKFHESHNSSEVFIHRSRLQWVGGPFGELVKDSRTGVDFENNAVQLCEEDDPRSFAVLRTAVYMTPVQLEPGVDRMLRLARCANRWGCWELFQGICNFFRRVNVLEDVEGLIKIADLTELNDMPSNFLEYFWECVGKRLRFFGFEEGLSMGQMPIEERICPKFPRLWEMAFSQNMVGIVLEHAKLEADEELMERLLEMLLCYMEPKINNNWTFCELLAHVVSPVTAPYCRRIVGEGVLDDRVSGRAMRLFTFMF